MGNCGELLVCLLTPSNPVKAYWRYIVTPTGLVKDVSTFSNRVRLSYISRFHCFLHPIPRYVDGYSKHLLASLLQ